MTMGGSPRIYSDSLQRRHAARDDSLRTQLAESIARVDLLGATDRLHEFMAALCEAAGILVCPRAGVSNARDERGMRSLRREALMAAARRRRDHQGKISVAEVVPNASSSEHKRAVADAGWLDSWLYARAHASLDAALTRGGAAATLERKLRLEASASLPADASSGCLKFSSVSAAEVRAATALHGGSGQGAGGKLESVGLRIQPDRVSVREAPDGSSIDSKHAVEMHHRCAAVRSEASGLVGLAHPTARNRALRAATKQANLGLHALSEPLWRALTLTRRSPGDYGGANQRGASQSAELAAICSTKVQLAGVPRGCHRNDL